MAQVIELSRQSDGEGYYLHFTGGFRAEKIADDTWQIEPVLINEVACATGPFTIGQLQALARQNDLRAVAFHQFGWMDGVYYSSWTPIVPGKTNHSEVPAGIWSNIAGNIARHRMKQLLGSVECPSESEVAQAFDDRDPTEELARYISLSLSSMDISVQQIADHYYEQLVNHMADGRIDGEKADNTLSQTLCAHVHSFFLHLGAARDYLGALIAFRIGLDPKKIDSMARLVNRLRSSNLPKDALLDLMFSKGNISPHPDKTDKFKVAGWIEEVTSLRNDLVHKRPYGSKFSESMGWASPLIKENGLFRYVRPLELEGSAGQDVFDVLHFHYANCMVLFQEAAIASGNDTAMMHITDKEVRSFTVKFQ